MKVFILILAITPLMFVSLSCETHVHGRASGHTHSSSHTRSDTHHTFSKPAPSRVNVGANVGANLGL